jgi:hypothetical protein
VDLTARGEYSAHVLGARAVEIVQQHTANSSAPFFIYLAFQSVHAPLQEFFFTFFTLFKDGSILYLFYTGSRLLLVFFIIFVDST